MKKHTNLLMKFDIVRIGQVSYSVPAKKLHSGEHLLDCKRLVYVIIIACAMNILNQHVKDL